MFADHKMLICINHASISGLTDYEIKNVRVFFYIHSFGSFKIVYILSGIFIFVLYYLFSLFLSCSLSLYVLLVS